MSTTDHTPTPTAERPTDALDRRTAPWFPAVETGCPECGFDGPHQMVDVDGPFAVIECANSECGIEFRETIKESR